MLNIFALCYSDIQNCVKETTTDIHLLLQIVTKYFFPIPDRHALHFFLQISQLSWIIAGASICFFTPPFLYTKCLYGFQVSLCDI